MQVTITKSSVGQKYEEEPWTYVIKEVVESENRFGVPTYDITVSVRNSAYKQPLLIDIDLPQSAAILEMVRGRISGKDYLIERLDEIIHK